MNGGPSTSKDSSSDLENLWQMKLFCRPHIFDTCLHMSPVVAFISSERIAMPVPECTLEQQHVECCKSDLSFTQMPSICFPTRFGETLHQQKHGDRICLRKWPRPHENTLSRRGKRNLSLLVKYIVTDVSHFSIEEMQGCSPSSEGEDASPFESIQVGQHYLWSCHQSRAAQ